MRKENRNKMKFGIISDIHGNIKALNLALNELEKRKVDKIIVLGDMVNGAPNSEDVVQKIIELGDKIIAVKGNHENYIIIGLPETVHDEKRKTSSEEKKRVEWFKSQLSIEAKEFIAKLPRERIYEVENKKIYISHYPIKNDGSFKKHIRKPSKEECEELFSNVDADVFLYGHTHIENYCKNGNKFYINPGSLGCPRKNQLCTFWNFNCFKRKY